MGGEHERKISCLNNNEKNNNNDKRPFSYRTYIQMKSSSICK